MDLLDMEGETERRVLDRSSEREDMEEGELSDADEVDTSRTLAVYSPQAAVYSPQATKPRVILERVGRVLPDLLNDIGVTEFNVLDEATTVKLGARAKRFNLDSHITYAEVSRMYETLGISEKDRKPGVSNTWRLETIHVRGTELMEEEDVMEYFKDYNPLEFCRVDNMSCNVAWGTAANSGKAMLGLSRLIASSHTRKVIHRIASSEEMEEERVVVEEDVDEVEGEKPVDPAEIEVAVPQGNWRIGVKHEKAEALFLRFAKVEEVGERMNFGELDARNRSLTMGGGLLSRSKRENLLAARDEQLDREQAEREREIDGKNPWGSIAENWGSGGRREQAREYPIPLEHMDRPPRSFRIGLKDWDAPEDEFDPVRVRPPMEEGGKRKRSIKDRLQMDKRVVDEDFEESEEEAAETFISEGDDDSDIEWTKKRKRPRMGMVADMVEKKKNVKDRIGGDQKQKKELIKRKIANKTSIEVFEEEEEEEVDDWEDEEEARRVDWSGREDLRLSVKLEDRPMLSLTKRLNERFRGGRLAGRLGDGIKAEVEEREVKNLGEREGRESRRQYSRDVESDGGDSLENDDGEDLKSDFGNAANMVIQVNQSDDETMDIDLKYEDTKGREREKESGRNEAERERRERDKRRENEARDRRKEREREKEKEREKEVKEKEKRKDLERERELERINREKKDQERELSRLKEREREKRRDRDVMEERTKRADKHRERENARQRERERERKDRDRDREREREKERERRREKEKDRSKTSSKSTSRKKKDESEDESSEVSSDESSSDSESESESSSNSETSSDSSSDSGKSSSDSESNEDDKKKKKGKEAKESSQRTDKRKETSKDAPKKEESRDRKDAKAKSKDDKKSEKNTEEKKAVKKEKKEENTDDKKKADELRNKLKNYLQAAQAAKEKKKDAEK